MTLNCIIIDDEPLAAELLASYVKRTPFLSLTGTFNNAITGMQAIREKEVHLCFMDIQMPVLNGVEAAKRLRRTDPSVSLVFVTDLKNRMADGYAVEALDFIVKPMNYLKFSVVMKRAAKRLSRPKSEVFLQSGGDLFRVAVDEILYVEVDRNRCFYHTENGVIEIWSSLKKEEERLKDDPFVKANSCYLVNLAHIKSISGDAVQVGGESLAISRSKRRELMEAFTAYVAENHL